MTPIIYRENGTSDAYTFQSKEQLKIDIDGPIEIIPLEDEWIMIVNENRYQIAKRFNFAASIIARDKLIYGVAITLKKEDLI